MMVVVIVSLVVQHRVESFLYEDVSLVVVVLVDQSMIPLVPLPLQVLEHEKTRDRKEKKVPPPPPHHHHLLLLPPLSKILFSMMMNQDNNNSFAYLALLLLLSPSYYDSLVC